MATAIPPDARRSRVVDDAAVAARMARHGAVERADGILLDWDGCVIVGKQLLPATRRLLSRHADKVAIVSNNSTHLPEQFSAILAQAGLVVPASHIILAGAEAVAWVAEAGDARRVMILGAPPVRSLALRRGINVVRENPDLVLLMRDTRFGYRQLARAVAALHRGARLVVANADHVHPGPGGEIVPETGALLAAVLACVPGIVPTIIGKPERRLFDRACGVLGITRDQALMIGDNAATDIAGAAALGIRSLHVSPLDLQDPEALVPAG